MIPVYVKDIKNSLKNKCYYSALSLSLALPDICGMAEFPEESSVNRRYTEWYDKYIGDYMAQEKDGLGRNNPWLSGEMVYNLRNTYLHEGSPNVKGIKVKDTDNQIDRFILVLGDGTEILDASIKIRHGKYTFKMIIVDITYLCTSISECALRYYEKNKEKFEFSFDVMTQDEFMDSNPPKEVQSLFAEFFRTGIIKNNIKQKNVKSHPDKKKTDISSKSGIKQPTKVVSKEKREAQYIRDLNH